MGAGDGADSGIAPDDRTGRRSRSVIDDAPLSGAAELSVCLAIGTRIDEAERSDLPIAISVFYSPGAAGQSIRDLGDILQQGAATAWQDTARSAPAGNYTLQY